MSKLPVFTPGMAEMISSEVQSRLFSDSFGASDTTHPSPTRLAAQSNVPDPSPTSPSLASVNAKAAASLYRTLQADQVRLIELKDAEEEDDKGNPSDTVHLSLVTVPLHTAPEYTALSYVWGSESDPAIVKIHGVDFHVTQNLQDALLHLRRSMAGDRGQRPRSRLLWADAIAINQSDVTERNDQVQRMSQIYASARQVAIWLGNDNNNLETLLGLITEIPGIVPDIDPEKLDKTSILDWHRTVDKWDPEASKFCMMHVSHFIELPYFKRIWVFQEVAYATDAYVMYGSKVAPFDQFYAFICYMMKLAACVNRLTDGLRSPGPMFKDPGNLFLGPEMGSALKGHFLNRGEWLTACSRRVCRDPRDKVYGFYGCFTEAIRARITVDYRKSNAQVCLDVTHALIQVSGSLTILDAVDGFPRTQADLGVMKNEKDMEFWLPSWSPDYSKPIAPQSWDTSQQYLARVNPNPAYFRFSLYGRVLHVHGLRVGTIRDTWSTEQIVLPRGYYPEEVPFGSTQIRLAQCAAGLQVRHDQLLELVMDGGRPGPEDALHRRLAAATNPTTGAIWIKDACSAEDCYYLNRLFREHSYFTLDAASPATDSGKPGGDDAFRQPQRRVTSFFTEPLGWAGGSVRKGDHVYVLEGCHLYVVLRDVEGSGYHGVVSTGGLYGQRVGFVWWAEKLRGWKLEEISLV